MVQFTKDTGRMINVMERVDSSIQRVMFTSEIGLMIRLKEKVFSNTLMEHPTMENGRTMSNLDSVKKLGMMVQSTRECI
jgi:hypothetical protein